ncbi:hypothetical protein OCU04_010463 [Sclerotinia nivalis]|uniref:Uncharacterized protein n=1 Tax=Sclerotinia nivalis TaxID=352851 RepID=A0A9X0AEL0_9HELO|nr:hypothetical protein OCU04_010463 [Sclerotinia nivalis]
MYVSAVCRSKLAGMLFIELFRDLRALAIIIVFATSSLIYHLKESFLLNKIPNYLKYSLSLFNSLIVRSSIGIVGVVLGFWSVLRFEKWISSDLPKSKVILFEILQERILLIVEVKYLALLDREFEVVTITTLFIYPNLIVFFSILKIGAMYSMKIIGEMGDPWGSP